VTNSWVKPLELLTANRLDILGKVAFAQSLVAGKENLWARELFRSCLRAMNPTGRFGEDGRKFSLLDYEYEFEHLIRSLSVFGFDSQQSKVAVANDGTLWNGAHRVAAALVLGLEVSKETNNELPQIYDFKYFERAGLPSDSLFDLSWEFASRVNSSRAFVFSDIRPDVLEALMRKIEQSASIFFRRTVELSQIGIRRNLQLMYGHLDWFSRDLLEKLVLERFNPNGTRRVTVVGFDPKQPGLERGLKESLRKELPGNVFERAIHGTDDWDETLALLEVWTSTNSMKFMNSSPIGTEERVMNELMRTMRGIGLREKREFVIDAGASLEVQGVRKAEDIDHVCLDCHPKGLSLLGDCHNASLRAIGMDPRILIYDPRMNIRWGGYVFSSLSWEVLKSSLAQEPKSVPDLHHVANFLEGANQSIYFDRGTEDALKRWQRRSRLQLLIDRSLSFTPEPLRRLIARVAQAYRNRKRWGI
jgi:hypothetical protein